MIYINNKEKIEDIKLEYDNFYVVTDFDKTLTKGDSWSTWGILSNANELGEEYDRKRTDLYNYYRPIEIDGSLTDEQKYDAMSVWWKAHINLFFEYGLKESTIKKAIESGGLEYRNGAKDFLNQMYKLNIPVIIISAGIGNIIEEFFKFEKDYYSNIRIISNFINFEKGIINEFKGETIHPFNKNIVRLDNASKMMLSGRKNILLLGDGLSDLKMISEEDRKNTITIGFLEEKIEENLESFNEVFDIVITENGTFNDVNNILKIY